MNDNDIYQRMDTNAQHIVDVTVASMMNDPNVRQTYSESFRAQYANIEEAAR